MARGVGGRPSRAHVRINGEDRWIARKTLPGTATRLGSCRRSGAAGVPDAGRGCAGRTAAALGAPPWPFLAVEPAARWGAPIDGIEAELEKLLAAARCCAASSGPHGVEREWCHPDVLRLLRRRSLAQLRREVEPVEPRALGRFLPKWQGVGDRRPGSGPACRGHRPARGHASAGERPRARRPAGSRRAAIHRGCSTSWARRARSIWVGLGSLGKDDGRVALYRPDRLPLLLPDASAPAAEPDADGAWLRDVIREHLRTRGASFYRDILAAAMTRGRRTRRARSPRARIARRALGSCLGHGGDQRHVRAAARAALAAQRRRPRAQARRPARSLASRAQRAWARPRRPDAGRSSVTRSRRRLRLRGAKAPTETERRTRRPCGCSTVTAS